MLLSSFLWYLYSVIVMKLVEAPATQEHVLPIINITNIPPPATYTQYEYHLWHMGSMIISLSTDIQISRYDVYQVGRHGDRVQLWFSILHDHKVEESTLSSRDIGEGDTTEFHDHQRGFGWSTSWCGGCPRAAWSWTAKEWDGSAGNNQS